MARAIHSNSIRAGLDEISRHYKLGNKLPNILEKTKNKRDLEPELMIQLGQYCAVDTELCRLIFDKMRVGYPENEFDLIDLSVRMFCEPVLLVDTVRAQAALDAELKERDRLITKAEVDLKILRSSDAFAEALQAADPTLIVPTKYSEKQKKMVWAFSKGDLDFMELEDDANPRVRALVKGRLAAKSTIGETRAIRFLEAGRDGQKLPVLLNYCAAHTTRWGGGNKMNLQNLRRDGELRKSILAPPGYLIIACDSSQIEARVLAWLADHHEMLKAFSDWDAGVGPDVYKTMAAVIYNKPVDTITKDERFVGKVVVLAAGYGMGADKYEYTLAAGTMGTAMVVTNDKCRHIINAFRTKNNPYPKLWNDMEMLLIRMLMRREAEYKILKITKDSRILLPNGLYLNYPGLEADYNQVSERYSDFKYYTLKEQQLKRVGVEVKGKKIYGGLLTENVIQALARIIVANQMLEISKELKVVTMTHDEVVCVVKESEVEQATQFMLTEMRKTKDWYADIPLNAEAESGIRYG
jgi:DNA polymerase